MGRSKKHRQLEFEFTEEEEVDGEPTLPLGHVLHAADEQAEHEDEDEYQEP
jgi:hypothetical protein